jgi:hypothetical protein
MTDTKRDGLDPALDSLVDEFSGVFAREDIAECLTDNLELLQPARVRGFLPLLAHRFAREGLTAAAKAGATTSRG